MEISANLMLQCTTQAYSATQACLGMIKFSRCCERVMLQDIWVRDGKNTSKHTSIWFNTSALEMSCCLAQHSGKTEKSQYCQTFDVFCGVFQQSPHSPKHISFKS